MRARRLWFGLLGILELAGLPAIAVAQPVGQEFQVNSYTTLAQRPVGDRAVAADASGNFVVVWSSETQDGSLTGIFGQRYDSAGEAQGAEFRVNSYTTTAQAWASVASDANGNFVVIWDSYTQDGSGWGVFGQRYDSAGEPLGSEFRVNSYTTGVQGGNGPSLAFGADGNFVVVWRDYGQNALFGQRFDSAGGALGAEFRVSNTTSQQNPSVAADASGNFVVVWESQSDGGTKDIFGRRFDSGGTPQGSQFRVNSFTTNFQQRPSVASDATGNFVVVWQSFGQDGPTDGIIGQRYDSGGVRRGGEFLVNSSTTGFQRRPAVASDASGNFVVVWEIDVPPGPARETFGQRYSSDGVAQGNEFQINSFTTGAQDYPSVALAGTNQFVVVWQSDEQDGSVEGVFAQRFDFSGETITVTSPNTNVKWKIGTLQNIQWTHNLGGGQTFRIELDRNNDGTYEELIAAAAPARPTRGTFAWTVTGPTSATARVRVSWTDDPGVSDASDVTFRITPAELDGER